MKKFLTYIFILFLTSSFFAQNTKVLIDVKIDSKLRMTGKIHYLLSATTDSIQIFKFSSGENENNLPNLLISRISCEHKRFDLEESSKWLVFRNGNRAKKITIEYELNLNDIFDWRKSFGYAIFPSTYKDKCWYPDVHINGSRDFYKDFSVTIAHPKDLKLLTSGTLQRTYAENNNTISHFKAENVRYYGLNAGWKYNVKSIQNDDVTLNYFCPEEKKEMCGDVAKTTIKAIKWYADKYGFFPKKTMKIAVGHHKWHGGFPSENMFYIHQGNLETSFIQWITAHELEHYYWGLHTLSATVDELSPILLANGIWMDHFYLSEAYQKPFTEIWNRYTPQAGMLEKYLSTYLANYEQEIGYTKSEQNFGFDHNSTVTHAKAAVGIYLLSNLIGVDSYFALQKEILNSHKGKQFSFEDFLALLNEKRYDFASKFIRDWYEDHAFIEYSVYNLKSEKVKDKWQYSFEIRKKGTVDYPIDIQVVDERGSTTNYTTKAMDAREVIEGVSKFRPVDINLDVNGRVPMWNSDNQWIQRAFIFALFRAGRMKMANQLARIHLDNHPDDPRLERHIMSYQKFKTN